MRGVWCGVKREDHYVIVRIDGFVPHLVLTVIVASWANQVMETHSFRWVDNFTLDVGIASLSILRLGVDLLLFVLAEGPRGSFFLAVFLPSSPP